METQLRPQQTRLYRKTGHEDRTDILTSPDLRFNLQANGLPQLAHALLALINVEQSFHGRGKILGFRLVELCLKYCSTKCRKSIRECRSDALPPAIVGSNSERVLMTVKPDLLRNLHRFAFW